jgi:hypothetical protein
MIIFQAKEYPQKSEQDDIFHFYLGFSDYI